MIDIDNLKVNFESKVLASSKVIIVPHRIADFDAIGSAIGLSLAVKKLKKVPFIIIDDKKYELDRKVQEIISDVKCDYGIISKQKYLPNMADEDLFIMTDVNKSHLVTCADLMVRPEKVIIIDHHDGDDKTVESDSLFIDSSVSSASEIVTKLLLKMKVKIPPNVAKYLLAGIYLDTKNLTKKNVSSETFRIAAALREAGADISAVAEMFSEDVESDRRVQELVSRISIVTYKMATMLADPENEYTTKELAKAADYALKYGVDASFAVGKLNDEIVAISARSKDTIDVGSVMSEFGGGGHPLSAAATVKNSDIEEVGKKLKLLVRPMCYKEKSTEN